MDELKSIAKDRNKVLRVYKYYFPDREIAPRTPIRKLTIEIWEAINKSQKEKELPDEIQQSVRVRRIAEQNK